MKKIDDKFMTQILNEGILYVTFKDKVVVDLGVARDSVVKRKEITDYSSVPMLLDAKNIKNLTKEARQYLGSKEGYNLLNAAAVLSESHVSNFIANFFIKVNLNRSSVPVKMFSNKQKAIDWLSRFK